MNPVIEQQIMKNCVSCNVDRTIDNYLSKKGKTFMTCGNCRVLKKINNEKYMCPHGRQSKSSCSKCLGHPINEGKCSKCKKPYLPTLNDPKKTCLDCRPKCSHGLFIGNHCLNCFEDRRIRYNKKRMELRKNTNYKNEKCFHDKFKFYCKKCSDPIEVSIRSMIASSKLADKNRDRYDANNFIDKCFIKQLLFESKKCFYCDIEMQLNEYSESLCTIERKDNKIGHIKSNCVLACRKCNFSRVGQRNVNLNQNEIEN